MIRRWFLISFVVFALAGLAAAQVHSLKVKVKYEGPGEVNDQHRIWVFLFDNPNFNQPGAMPIGMGSSDINGGEIDFSGLTASTVYLATMYDHNGNYLAMGPPTTGTPVGVYADAAGPRGVNLPQDEMVEVTFDDTFRMP